MTAYLKRLRRYKGGAVGGRLTLEKDHVMGPSAVLMARFGDHSTDVLVRAVYYAYLARECGDDRLKAAIDVTGAFWKYRTGVQNYYFGLMEGLSSRGLNADEGSVILIDRHATDMHVPIPSLAGPALEYRSAARLRLFEVVQAAPSCGKVVGTGIRIGNDGVRALNWLAARSRNTTQRMLADVDVLQVWNWGIQRGPWHRVIMMHDVLPLLFPHLYRPHFVWLTKASMAFARDKATAVMTVSAHTKGELIAMGGVPEHKIHVIHHGVDALFRPVTDPNRVTGVLQRYGLAGVPYLLSVGFLDPRKNIGAHIRAFEQLIDDPSMSDLRFVLVGPKILKTRSVLDDIKSSRVRERIVLTGYVPRDELPILYGAARAFVYCSLYEGFGLPVLEAMACGTPVITSNCTSLPEVGGDAALLVDPRDVDQIADAMSRAVGDTALRRDLIARGAVRAAQFSWQKCAQEHLQVYREACA